MLQWEKDAIIAYAKTHPGEGYRRLTYMVFDDNVAAASPATTNSDGYSRVIIISIC